jgi:inhibitor of KinA sporulation pathway (predicted exonuclease)
MIVYDLEYTTWAGALARAWSGPGEHREVVQIGAVKLDAGLAVIDRLELVVRPRMNPVLSDYFINLTGLDQQRLEREGVGFPEALARLAAFAEGGKLLANGADEGVLQENCRLNGLDSPFAGRCIDISSVFIRAAAASTHVASCRLGQVFGLGLDQPHHDALGDAIQVAAALRHLVEGDRLSVDDLTS